MLLRARSCGRLRTTASPWLLFFCLPRSLAWLPNASSDVFGLSALGNVTTLTFSHVRINEELAKKGVVPLSRIRTGERPSEGRTNGLLLSFIPSLIVIVTIPDGDTFGFIVEIEDCPIIVVVAHVAIGPFIFRLRVPVLNYPFRARNCVACGYLLPRRPPILLSLLGKTETILSCWLYPIAVIVLPLSGVVDW